MFLKNIFIEGIQGMGKSYLLQKISEKIPEFYVCREGDYSPADLAWCAYMTPKEYQGILNQYETLANEISANTVLEGSHYVVCYTKIITDLPGFHKNLEQYEIYNGAIPPKEFEDLIISRYRRFSGSGYLLECAIMQNILENLMLFLQYQDDEILAFYEKLFHVMHKDRFRLVYLYSDRIEDHIKIIQKERADGRGNQLWYELVMSYLASSPYGRVHGYKDFDDLTAHLAHRQRLELRIIREIFKDHARIFPAKQWETDEITDWCLHGGI